MRQIGVFIIVLCTIPGTLFSISQYTGHKNTITLKPDNFISADHPSYVKPDVALPKWDKSLNIPNWFYLGLADYYGYGWFRYKIILHDTTKAYSLYAPFAYGNSYIYFNEVLIFQTTSDEQIAQNGDFILTAPSLISIDPEIVQKGVNYISVRTKGLDGMGGHRYPLNFGLTDSIERIFVFRTLKASSYFAILIFLSIFFGLYYFTQKQEYYLHFAGASFSLALWQCVDEGLIQHFFSLNTPISLIGYTGALWSPIFIIAFFHSFFKFKKRFMYHFLVIGLLSIFFTMVIGYLFTGNLIFFQIRVFYPLMLFTLAGQIYVFFLNIKAIRMKKEMAGRMFLGVCILFATVISLYLGEIFLNRVNTYIADGFFAMIVVFSSTLQTRYAAVYNELQTAYTDLQSLDKVKEEFLANTSNELRTPLHAISNLIENVFKSQENINPKTTEQLSLIKYSASRLSYLVDDILDFSNIQQNDIRLNIENHSLNEQIYSVISLTQHLIDVNQLKIVNDVIKDYYILADQGRVQQILFNIIGNAIKFTESGTIQIQATQNQTDVMVEVIDSGIGISDEKLATIFDPFAVSEEMDTKKYRGAGLGLAITKELLGRQNGTIDVLSKEGSGTRVIFSLPRGKAPNPGQKNITKPVLPILEQSMAFSNTQSTAVVPEGEYVLIVDDDPILNSIIADILQAESFRSVVANSAEKALQIIRESEKPVLAIVDIMMPDLSGIELSRKIRLRYSGTELPILMFTAKTQMKDLTEAINAGASDFVTKPVDYNEFILRVRNLLSMGIVEKDKKNELKQQKREIFYDLHEHLGSFLKGMQDSVKRLSVNEFGDKSIIQELNTNINKALENLRDRLEYIEDLTVVSKDFLSGLRQILVRRYQATERTLVFHAKEELYEKIKEKKYSIIRQKLFIIMKEIVTNDLKYGTGESVLKFRDKGDLLFIDLKASTSYNPVKNKTGTGTSSIMHRVSGLGGKLQMKYEKEKLTIGIVIPWEFSDTMNS